jgi:hypothetical protein
MKKLLLLLVFSTPLFAQDDLLAILEKEDAKKTSFTHKALLNF